MRFIFNVFMALLLLSAAKFIFTIIVALLFVSSASASDQVTKTTEPSVSSCICSEPTIAYKGSIDGLLDIIFAEVKTKTVITAPIVNCECGNAQCVMAIHLVKALAMNKETKKYHNIKTLFSADDFSDPAGVAALSCIPITKEDKNKGFLERLFGE